MEIRTCIRILFAAALVHFPGPAAGETAGPSEAERLALVHAVMCEDIRDHAPDRETVVFSVASERAICFTFFNPVPKKTVIYHRWYKKDRLNSKVRLRLQPPRWSTFSRILLRETDKGPWRVEISDESGRVFKTLRFSITD